MFSLIPVINFPGQESIPLALPYGQNIEFSQNSFKENVTTSKDAIIQPDDSPFFSDIHKNSNDKNSLNPANKNESSNLYKPYGTYEPNIQNNQFPPYPLYGWSFPSPYQEQKSQKQKENEKIIIEDVEEFESEILAKMEELETEGIEEKQFEVKFNIHGFTLKDIKIQRHDGQILIEGKQRAKTSFGAFYRTFTYIINIPENIETEKLYATLSDSGIFCIKSKTTEKI
uniref:SHSP domain-containing protein n=1 Tax=Panagrolaimus sp. PS1159 TaxID=55785 RepID=A0AC35F1I1_9BILA